MSWLILSKLLAMFAVAGLGWTAERLRWLGGGDTARVLSAAAFSVFVPALLFRTAARLDLAALPWHTLAAYFVPTLAYLLLVYGVLRSRGQNMPAAAPATQAIGASYGNAVQVGIPVAAALFGEAGLGLHLTLVSLHGLILLTVLTALVEHDLARAEGGHALGTVLRSTVRNTVIHPVVLPLLGGLLWNAGGLKLPDVLDEALRVLGSAVVPLCLVMIGVSLAHYGFAGASGFVLRLCALKLVALPALVLVAAHWGFGLAGTPLAVVVVMAAMPVGSNALIFAQRYRTLEAPTTAAIVISTLAFTLTAPAWLALLSLIS
jgi:malonate transporter and related proteins